MHALFPFKMNTLEAAVVNFSPSQRSSRQRPRRRRRRGRVGRRVVALMVVAAMVEVVRTAAVLMPSDRISPRLVGREEERRVTAAAPSAYADAATFLRYSATVVTMGDSNHFSNLKIEQRHEREKQRGLEEREEALWYPNWSGGLNTCLLACSSSSISSQSTPLTTDDRGMRKSNKKGIGGGTGEVNCHPLPSYMTSQKNVMKFNVQECCDSYYWWVLQDCLSAASVYGRGDDFVGEVGVNTSVGDGGVVGGTGIGTTMGDTQEGSHKWYADYTSFKCVQDCPVSTIAITSVSGSNEHVLQCGGLLSSTSSSNIQTFSTPSQCCDAKFSYLALGKCLASSENREYRGSGLFYVDYVGGRCVQDCVENTTTTRLCGGIITESSTQLYPNAADCCSAQLSYIDPLLCESRSEVVSDLEEGDGYFRGTFRLYPHLESGSCVIDQDPANIIVCSIGYTCKLIPLTSWVSKLYPVSPAGVEECCRDVLLSSSSPMGSRSSSSYCKAKTMGVVSRKWFVDYGAMRCHQDCEPDKASPSCTINRDPTATLHDTPEECCSSKLPYRNQPKCVADSTHLPYHGSNKYYVNYRESKCTQDCPLSSSENSLDCGGVVGDSSTMLYEVAALCCVNGLGYMSLELCVDRSDALAMGTGNYYLNVEDSVCVKDTAVTPCPPGETCQRVDGWVATLYKTITDCCNDGAAMLPGSVNHDYCLAVSTGTATNKWFRQDDSRCSKHCTGEQVGVECGAPLDPSLPHYDTAHDCCSAELWNLVGVANVESCVEISAYGGGNEVLVSNNFDDTSSASVSGGTEEYYVDWIHQTCVKNCLEDEKDSECGGISTSKLVDLYSDVDECCDNLHYIDRSDCVKGSS